MTVNRNTAIHEAGHAVVALMVGRAVKHASIVPNEDHIGHVQYSDRAKRNPSTDNVLGYMTSALAGVAAERRAGHRPRRWTWQGDWQIAMTGASELSGGDSEQAALFYRIAQRRARLMVDLRWLAIVQVADLLESQRFVTGDELRRIVLPSI
jgi:hypothetical protein